MRFEPWVGSDWGKPENTLGGKKVLILGESHYNNEDEWTNRCDPDATRNVIRTYALQGRHAFFSKLLHVLGGKPRWSLTQSEVDAFWQSVAFYNFVPVFVGNDNRIAPNTEMFTSGVAPFRAVLAELEPEHIIVCGYRLWSALLVSMKNSVQTNLDGHGAIEGVPALRMQHPSTGFAMNDWKKTLQEFLRV